MPGVLLNSVLGMLPDRTVAVRSGETLCVVVPMYNEEHGARRCLASILRQEEAPDQIAVSVNGGRDNTYEVVARILRDYGYRLKTTDDLPSFDARLERWLGGTGSAAVTLMNYRSRTAKSESVNNLFRAGLVTSDRVMLVDGDTILHPGFVGALRDNFYRLRERRVNGQRQFIIEDYALQSGAVRSWLPDNAGPWQRVVSAGRQAEYAFSTLLRRGQASIRGSSAIFGNSRLFTVVGCGFAARRELFPMPGDTRTEDHEFTLTTQALPVTETRLDADTLDRMGLRIVDGDRQVPPSEWLRSGEKILLRTGGNARFVPEAQMLTEDPQSLNGFLNQVERWNGGGLEGALGRVGRRLPANVAWTVWMAQLENVVGVLLLLLVLPSLVALNLGNPSIGMPWKALLGWLGFDMLLSTVLNTAGFWLQRRARGMASRPALASALRASLLTLPAYLLIRYLNPFTWVAAATEVVPAWWRGRRRARQRVSGVAWERPRGARASFRTHGIMASVMAAYPLLVGFVVAPNVKPVNAEGWRLTHQRPVVHMENHVSTSPLYDIAPQNAAVCGADQGWLGAQSGARLLRGDATAYERLGLWDLLTLGRLVPLLSIIEHSAGAFDVPVEGLLMIFINESLLDPLAHGPTGDLGLSQMTSDALTLLAAASNDPASAIYSPNLVTDESNVFDPVFSACAGAAKLAWSFRQPRVQTLGEAYALYINPVHGFVNGRIGDTWQPLVAQMEALEPNVTRLANVFSRFEEDPGSLHEYERRLVQIAFDVRDGNLTTAGAYSQALQVISDARIDDRDVYRRVLERLYGESGPMASTSSL